MTTPTASLTEASTFTAATLHAPSLYALVGNTNEFRLIVDEGGAAKLIGEGYTPAAVARFQSLIMDWEAMGYLPEGVAVAAGTYLLRWSDEATELHLLTPDGLVLLPNTPLRVELNAGDEEE